MRFALLAFLLVACGEVVPVEGPDAADYEYTEDSYEVTDAGAPDSIAPNIDASEAPNPDAAPASDASPIEPDAGEGCGGLLCL